MCWGDGGVTPLPLPLAVVPAPWVTAELLTEVVRVAQVEGVAAVHVVVQRLLDQVLRLIAGQLGHPGGQ